MKCKRDVLKLSAYLDGELDSEQMKMIDLHLRQCSECRNLLEEMRSSWKLVGILPEAEITPYFYTRLRARIESETKLKKPAIWARWFFYPLTTAAVLFIGIVVGTVTGMNGELTSGGSDLEQEIVNTFKLDNFDNFPSASLGKVYVELTNIEQE